MVPLFGVCVGKSSEFLAREMANILILKISVILESGWVIGFV